MRTSSFERDWIPRIMIFLHAVGILGILLGHGSYFLDFTAVNLFINGLLALWVDWSRWHWTWIVAAFGGIGVEIIGVQSGWLFGDYSYGESLGPQIAGVPLILGVLWWVSLLGCRFWTLKLFVRVFQNIRGFKQTLLQAFIGATMMTLFDGLIEPVAIEADWWAWAGGSVPVFNYASWWALSFLFYLLPKPEGENIGAGILVSIFIAFFIFLNLFTWTH